MAYTGINCSYGLLPLCPKQGNFVHVFSYTPKYWSITPQAAIRHTAPLFQPIFPSKILLKSRVEIDLALLIKFSVLSSRFWVFKNKDLFYGPANIQQLGLTEELASMDAALEWKRNGKIYFFKGSKYWRYDRTRSKLDDGYPRDISVWKGIPNNINAGFQWKNGRTYFFKDDKYYAFDDYLVKVLEDSNNPYPRDVASYWMGCTNPEVNIDPAVGAAYGVLSNVIVLITCFLVTWLF